MRRLLLLLAMVALTLPVFAQGTAAIEDSCRLGGTTAKVQGTQSTNTLQGIVTSCTVTVYLTGTQTKATIFSDASGTTLSNPFTANAVNSVNPGGWIFWTAVNQGYDIVLSGGIPPNNYQVPVTLSDRYPGFSFSGGSSTTPCGNRGMIQLASITGTSLDCNANFFFNQSISTFESLANTKIAALESIPRTLYDPWDTTHAGGLAAAIAGTSGFTPTQVIQATIDYGECQAQMGLASSAMRIALPNSVIQLSQLLVWPTQELSGDSLRTQPHLQHTVATASMIKGHSGSDTITCSNGTTYTPGAANGVIIQNVGLGGTGAVSGALDIGIEMNGSGWFVYNISGFSNAFGSQAILDDGFQNFIYRVGYPGAQMSGCASYVAGLVSGTCAAVQQGSTDGEIDYVLATDNIGITSGHPAGPCYPNCAAILIGGANVRANGLFAQLSDIDIIVNGANLRGSTWRMDATNREMIRFNGGGAVVSDFIGEGACLDASLATAYAAGTPTGCFGLSDFGQANQISGVNIGGNAFFGPGYIQAEVFDDVSGFSSSPNTYWLSGGVNVANTTSNDLLIACACDGNNGTPRVQLPSMAPAEVGNTGTANVQGVTGLAISTTTPLTTLTQGISGQHITVYAGIVAGVGPQTGATIGLGGNIQLCPGLTSEPLSSINGVVLTKAGLTGSATWGMTCNDPQANFVHLNWVTNGPPTNPSIIDAYGNSQLRQVLAINLGAGVQLHGPTLGSGEYCFEEEAVYADGTHNVSPLACTNIDLTMQTPGAIFLAPSTQAVTYNLWLVSNTSGSGIATGKIGPLTSGSFWDGPTTIAAGGNSATPPLAGENTTGLYLAINGVLLNTSGSQPTCTVNRRGQQWVLYGSGSADDTYQICEQHSAAFSWVTH